jgi:hypothetical protein
MWQKELERVECKSLIKGQVITGMPFGSGTSDPTFNIIAERERYRKIIDGKLAEIQIARGKIMEYICSIDNSLTRQIVFLYCVSNMNFNQIAKEFGPGYTLDAVRQTYYRQLKKDGIT